MNILTQMVLHIFKQNFALYFWLSFSKNIVQRSDCEKLGKQYFPNYSQILQYLFGALKTKYLSIT